MVNERFNHSFSRLFPLRPLLDTSYAECYYVLILTDKTAGCAPPLLERHLQDRVRDRVRDSFIASPFVTVKQSA